MLDVRVLGTKFNVTALPTEAVTEVVLQEGKVNVSGKDVAFSAELKPNEKFTFDNELRTSDIQTVNAEQFSAWKDGLLVFRNEPLSEVLKRIGRWYNVNIVIGDQELMKFRYRATFQEEQLEEVIRLIALTIPIEYEFEGRKVGGNGAFEQRRITIRKTKN
jgi:ferric-dicitrate binding protein FerR (iron transport regulator)